MVFSFFGLSKPATAVCDALIKLIKNYRSENKGDFPTIEPGGVYVPNLTKGANFAAQRSMSVYMNGLELIKKSDIIIVCVAEQTLTAFAKNMRRHNISGKIFCHFNPAFDADILDFDSENTYVSLMCPILKKNGGVDLSYGLIMQGYGKRYDEMADALKAIGINVSHLNSDEKCIYQSAMNLTVKLSDFAHNSAVKLAKSVLGSDGSRLDAMNQYHKSADYDLVFYNPIASEDEEYIENQRKLIKAMGYDDVSLLYASMLLMESLTGNSEMNGKIKEIAKSIIKNIK